MQINSLHCHIKNVKSANVLRITDTFLFLFKHEISSEQRIFSKTNVYTALHFSLNCLSEITMKMFHKHEWIFKYFKLQYQTDVLKF